MKAWVKRGSGLQLDEVPDPVPASDEVLVRVHATSLNRGEVRGVARAADGFIPGWDVAGTAPDGRRVVGIVRNGAWAELVRVPAAQLTTVPDDIALDVASTLPVAALTVLRALDVAGSLVGKRMLVTGGSGGVGQFAIQMGLAAGALVTAVSSRLQSDGSYAVVPAIDAARGQYDLVLESVGGASLATAIDRVAPAGVVVTIGNSSEEETTFNARSLYARGGARIYGLLIFEEVESRRITGGDLRRIFALLTAGKVHAPIEVRRPFAELPAVLAELEQRSYAGKAVLTIP